MLANLLVSLKVACLAHYHIFLESTHSFNPYTWPRCKNSMLERDIPADRAPLSSMEYFISPCSHLEVAENELRTGTCKSVSMDGGQASLHAGRPRLPRSCCKDLNHRGNRKDVSGGMTTIIHCARAVYWQLVSILKNRSCIWHCHSISSSLNVCLHKWVLLPVLCPAPGGLRECRYMLAQAKLGVLPV